jgi:hypothetical protein
MGSEAETRDFSNQNQESQGLKPGISESKTRLKPGIFETETRHSYGLKLGILRLKTRHF